MPITNGLVGGFRKKVAEIKETLEEREILTSAGAHAYLQNLAEAVTHKFGVAISLKLSWNKPDDFVAFANGRDEMYFNCNNVFTVRATTLREKVVLLKALVLHECGHLMFTDFKMLDTVAKVWEKNRKLFPEPACSEYKDFLVDAAAMDPAEAHQWLEIWNTVENSIEDGFIEYQVLREVPGEGKCLQRLRAIQKGDAISVKQMRNNGVSIQNMLYDMVLQLAKYNTVKMDADDKSDPAVKALLDNYNLIQKAVHTPAAYDRVKLINELFSKLYYFFKQEENKEESSSQQSQDGQENKQQQNESQDSDENQGQAGSGETDEGSEGQGNGSSENAQSSSGGGDDVNSSSQESSSGNQVGTNSENSGESGKSSKRPNPANIKLQNDPIRDKLSNNGSVLNDRFLRDQKEDESSQLGSNSDKLSQMEEQEKEYDSCKNDKDAEEALKADQFKNELAQEKAYEDLEKDLADALKDEASQMDLGEFNRNIEFNFEREVKISDNDKKRYEDDMKEINGLIKRTVKEIRDKIKDKQQGGKINGLYQGRYLDSHSLYRFDQRVLCKNDLPEDIPNMAIGLLIDASGSMTYEKKQEYARQTALLLYHFGKELGVPVMVCSHNAGSYNACSIKSLADYGSVDGNDKYRICQYRPSLGNRDGAALRYVAEKVSQRHEESKIVFVISDGLPSAYNGADEGAKDIKSVLMDYHKKDVKFITCGLGDDAKQIKQIYQQGLTPAVAAEFLDCSDPKQMPINIVRCIRALVK